VLLAEDREDDAEILLAELRRLGYEVEWTRVETREAMAAVLAEPWDVIVSDFAMPAFNALEALALCREREVDVPFIIVSGTIEEEDAVESLRLGAYDFITKGRLARLGPAIERGRRELGERHARRSAEARLQQAQKMEAVGQLAGGVAHDFNNLLGVIEGYCDLLLKDVVGDERTHQRLEQVRRAAGRGAALTRQLLAFSRQKAFEARPVDLNAVVSGLEGMLRRLISEDIQISSVLAAGLYTVNADAQRIEQVLMNLAINARDAMPGGGRLIIETSNVDLDETYVLSHPDTKVGPYAMLAVSDTGHGMDAQVLSHVFEPFFTTKGAGKGTGLGLATVYGIAHQSGGHVAVYSEPGRGSTFKVYLPRAEATGEEASPPPVAPLRRTGSETVLLVEDEPDLRSVIRDLLGEGGYTVIDGPTPEASLAAAEAYRGPIDLMVTDVIMPRMTGLEAAARIRAKRPQIKVLYISGYANAAVEHQGGLPNHHAFLQKPFSLDALLSKVREVLDAPSSRGQQGG